MAVGGAGVRGDPFARRFLGQRDARPRFRSRKDRWLSSVALRRAERSKAAPAGRAGLPVSCYQGWTRRTRGVQLEARPRSEGPLCGEDERMPFASALGTPGAGSVCPHLRWKEHLPRALPRAPPRAPPAPPSPRRLTAAAHGSSGDSRCREPPQR